MRLLKFVLATLSLFIFLSLSISQSGATAAGSADLWSQPGPGVVLGEIKGATEPALYSVQLQAPPLASYRGEIAGLTATNPAARDETRLDTDSPASQMYLAYLEGLHTQLLAAVEGAIGRQAEPIHNYQYAFNGVALELTPAEAQVVAGLPGVRRVQRAFMRYPLTDAGPEWIGAPAVWDGSGSGATLGEGVVVGVIDTGINHDHPSFADVGGDGYDHTNPRGQFYGLCDPLTGTPFCNDKLIGVWDFTGTSPEDDNQHGSHTASTAAGNILDAQIIAPTLTLSRELSGVAPHANLITYKACIAVGCVSTSLVAAIDQATADGVDVINYSIGGGPSHPWGDADSDAFLGATDAGIFVATSAGNDGPGPETVGSPANAPWVTSVGASTHHRAFVNALVDMSGGATTAPADIQGKSFTSGYGPAPIVHAADSGDGQCMNAFPPGTWDGEIVVCDRGTIPRVTKCDNVAAGGAGGCVLANTAAEGESTVADPHSIPAVHIGYSDAEVLEAWVRDGGSGHTATIAGTTADENAAYGDVIAGFSSRGANAPVPGVIKPDVAAPGVDILAAINTVDPTAPPEYGVLSGTSMASPHTAGAAALLRALHPDWSPAEVKSALMTTAFEDSVRKEDGTTPADPFDMGAGRVDLTRAGRAGLVLHEAEPNYSDADPDTGGDPTTLNLPSLGHGRCEGDCSWTRTVRSTAAGDVTWTAQVSAAPGLGLTITPASFTLAPGETETIHVEADVSGLNVGRWTFGRVTLVPDDGTVPAAHLPVAVLPGGPPQLVEITAESDSGAHQEQVTSPLDVQELEAYIYGLIPGEVTQQQLEQDPTPLEPYDTDVGTFYITIDVPAGARFLVTEIVDTTSTDLDLFVGRDANGDGPEAAEEVCSSTSPTASEACRVVDLEAGTYWIMVQNWLSGQAVDDVTLEAVVIPGSDKGNLTVTGPGEPVPADTPFDVTIAWNEPEMDPGEVWYGLAELGTEPGGPANVGALLIKINRVEDGDPTPQPLSAKATGGGWLQPTSGKKINFSVDVASTSGGPEGHAKLNDKTAGAKIHVTTITAITEVGDGCGDIADASNAVEIQGDGSYNGANASFRLCVEDNGEPGRDADRFYLECAAGCDYRSSDRTVDDVIDGGNIQVERDAESGSDDTSEPAATTMILDPLLMTEATAGELQLFEVTVYDQNQDLLADAEVTLTRTAADGTVETMTAITDLTGTAAFSLVNLNQAAEYIATAGSAESNTIHVDPLLP